MSSLSPPYRFLSVLVALVLLTCCAMPLLHLAWQAHHQVGTAAPCHARGTEGSSEGPVAPPACCSLDATAPATLAVSVPVVPVVLACGVGERPAEVAVQPEAPAASLLRSPPLWRPPPRHLLYAVILR
jgi:hypothetical protein